ncbi:MULTISPECIES: FHA domain-containing protein [unclassified Pseudactinotalea]|uniref:FHA domain-containing protein n=1 Tax=unclassified Pseudactinotalea TaxID=2649176 RepID=UPI00128C17A5|nr:MULTISPECIES: FHA domain-containing protein [unclassified Pseudactinotalea]MPV49277.1 FHA domain-containing protein [Pseudactinotalea sp. HY160]QGH69427.1 FHA domain-containing protein [Pseudactinotalea sp. HY158]
MTTQGPQVPDPASAQSAAGRDQEQQEHAVESPARPDVHTTATFDRVGSVDPDYAPPSAIAAGDRAAIEALPPASALLIVQHGPNAGARFLLDAERVTAGRHTRADIFLDDVTVSRKHAEFLSAAGGFTVRDVGSLNGTYVNRERIETATLRAGDEVQIGKYRLTFHPSPNRPATGTAAGPESAADR